jgi:hypothetical protein
MSNFDRVMVQSDSPSFFEVDLAECESWRFQDRSEPHFWRTPTGVFFVMAINLNEGAPPQYEACDVGLAMICTPTMIYMTPTNPPKQTAKRARLKPPEVRMLVEKGLKALIAMKMWGLSGNETAKHCGVSKSAYHEAIRYRDDLKRLRAKYDAGPL